MSRRFCEDLGSAGWLASHSGHLLSSRNLLGRMLASLLREDLVSWGESANPEYISCVGAGGQQPACSPC